MPTWQDPKIAAQTVVGASLDFQVVRGPLKESITVYQASKGEYLSRGPDGRTPH